MDRRQLLKGFATSLTWAAVARRHALAAGTGLRGTAINQVSEEDDRQLYLWFGDAFMVVKNLSNGVGMPSIDRVAWTLADWDANRVTAELKRHNLDARIEAGGMSVVTTDLNGYPLVVCSRNPEPKPSAAG